MAFLAISFLGAVFVGLVAAAAYAVLGRPKSPTAKSRRDQIISGFRITAAILIGFFAFCFLLIGIGVGFMGVQSYRLSSRPLAILLTVGTLAFLGATARRWCRYFPGLLFYSVFNGLTMLSSGHILNNPKIPVSRPWMLALIILTVASGLSSLRFSDDDYHLNLLDITALLGWWVAFAIAGNQEKYGLVATTASTLALFLAFSYYHLFAASGKRSSRSPLS